MQIISPQQYTTSPWKNGKGETIELAISDNSSLAEFSYRLSIATVSENGLFSNFNNLQRNLFLLSGNGIVLKHQHPVSKNNTEDRLVKLLSVAKFDGGLRTDGILVDGTITDFNVMHNPTKYHGDIYSIDRFTNAEIKVCDICFVYAVDDIELVNLNDQTSSKIAKHNLVKLNNVESDQFQLKATSAIVVQLTLIV